MSSTDVWPVISIGGAFTTEEVILYCDPENGAFITKIIIIILINNKKNWYQRSSLLVWLYV